MVPNSNWALAFAAHLQTRFEFPLRFVRSTQRAQRPACVQMRLGQGRVDLHGPLRLLQRRAKFLLLIKDAGQIVADLGHAGPQFQGLFILGGGLVQSVLRRQPDAVIEMEFGQLRLFLDGLLQMENRLRQLAPGHQRVAQVAFGIGKNGVERESFFVGGDGGIGLAVVGERVAQVVPGHPGIWILADGVAPNCLALV